eukprot:CAMPEP_0113955852 /NCGR_PEP_ID=MMETSP0011_2-20120614/1661_1 /TAXON_ID=101924 /ORGANISM="Rhodosorus marinus" /LENGTH=588 /DNA_ID=CAMNT_0000965783 /DNA_START=116 /DNA_END=1882 /DNA_ORIENTATION=+ /assembly_acc=CAM_ASM_000156
MTSACFLSSPASPGQTGATTWRRSRTPARMSLPMSQRAANMQSFRAEEKLLFTPNVGAGRTDFEGESVSVVYAYPNEYAVGICSLGYQIVWATISDLPGVSVSRMFTNASEMLPSKIDLLGFSMSWELDFPGLFETLSVLNVPRRSSERSTEDPIVFGGGPVLTANAEPFADFFDVILVGDGEELLEEFISEWQKLKSLDISRTEALTRLAATVEGAYVPELYEVEYECADGPVKSVKPVSSEVPAVVKKRTFRSRTLAASTVITPISAWENIHMVEAVRSCPEMCRFCLASYSTLPFRSASIEEGLIPAIDRGLEHTRRIGILGASVTQHPQFDELVDKLSDQKYDDVRISLSSVRTNSVTEKLARMLSTHDSRSITVAVESGSERLRNVINKKLENDQIVEAARVAQIGGLSSMKLYGMAGLPSESMDDVEETLEMFRKLKSESAKLKSSFRFTFGCSTFVPKAHTPFQWFPVRKDSDKKLKYLDKELRKIGVDFRPESYKWSVIQALISRGDRRVSMVLEKAAEYGGSQGSIKRAMKDLKGQLPPLQYYAHEEWDISTCLPWSAVQMSLSENLLRDHREQAMNLV